MEKEKGHSYDEWNGEQGYAVFESKSGRRERGVIWQNIADNLKNFEEFAVTVQSLRDYFTYWLATCAWKPKVPAASYVQRLALAMWRV